MEFNKKLQELRKSKQLTQEELAEILFVSRTAISKWESGRGYPNIESLKAIAGYFNITIDQLLSSNELLTIAQKDKKHIQDLVFGLLDVSVLILVFLPFFRQEASGIIEAISLLHLTELSLYLRIAYYVGVFLTVGFGMLTLTLQNYEQRLWLQNKGKISLIICIFAVILFIMSLQPYAATYLFIITAIKSLMLIKRR